MSKIRYTFEEVTKMIDRARYDELSRYYRKYDRNGLKGKERLEELKKKIEEGK